MVTTARNVALDNFRGKPRLGGDGTGTIRPFRSDGALPNSRWRHDGMIEGALNQLNPLLVRVDVIGIALRSRAERNLVSAEGYEHFA